MFMRIDEPITISEMYGMVFCNLDEDWIEDFKDMIKKESTNLGEKFNFEEIVTCDYYNSVFDKSVNNLDEFINVLVSSVVCIESEYFENTALQLKNKYIDNPTCETRVEDKVINFYGFLDRYGSKEEEKSKEIRISYTESRDMHMNELHLLSQMMWRAFKPAIISKYNFDNIQEETDFIMTNFVTFGQTIDSFINDKASFFVLDYIMDILNNDNETNSYTVVKLFSIIELALVNSRTSISSQLREKVHRFMDIEQLISISEKKKWTSLAYRIRCKIAHGDYMQLNKLTDKYINQYMQQWQFDFYEFSKINWAFSGLTSELRDIVARILLLMLNDKNSLELIKQS